MTLTQPLQSLAPGTESDALATDGSAYRATLIAPGGHGSHRCQIPKALENSKRFSPPMSRATRASCKMTCRDLWEPLKPEVSGQEWHEQHRGIEAKSQEAPKHQKAIQHYLGHRNIQNTVRYTQLSPQRFKDFWKD
jgi:hypothetical protein